jgi:hypothetical protein
MGCQYHVPLKPQNLAGDVLCGVVEGYLHQVGGQRIVP